MNKLTQDQLDDLTAEMNNYMTETGRKLFPPAKADELATYGAKRCSRCTSVKLTEDFAKLSSSRDGLKGICKACSNAENADYCQQNRDKELERYRNYREQNREKRNEYDRAYLAANREKRNEYHRTRNRTNEFRRLSNQLNHGYHRAVEAGNEADWVTPEQLLTYWAAKGIPALECYLTGTALTPFDRSIDHVVAIGNGGGHTVDNLMPATLEANKRKANLEPDEALERLNQ